MVTRCVVFALVAASAMAFVGGGAVRSADAYDRRCTAALQVPLVRSVVAAFNAGNAVKLDRLVAREPAFRWFSDAAANRLGRAAEDRSTLRAYVIRRHRRHDHISLVRFGATDGAGRVNIALDIRRRADDYRPGNVIHGKFEAICPPGHARIIVWSI